MATQTPKPTPTPTPSSTLGPHPSPLWTRYQSLQTINNRHLTLPPADLRNKWIVITGANSGIGREAALQFARWGGNLILGCRGEGVPPHEVHPDVVVGELKKVAREAGHMQSVVEWWECDMADLGSVEGFARRWGREMDKRKGKGEGRALDLLINNAGVAGYNTRKRVKYTKDGFELVHQINFLSHVLLTLILLPSLALSPSPRIICTTSSFHYFGHFTPRHANTSHNNYADNKLYFQTWIVELQARMLRHDAYKHIVIHGVHPGFVNSNIWAETTLGKRGCGGAFFRSLLRYVAVDNQQGSVAIVNAATAAEWGGEEGPGGRFANRVWEMVAMPQTRDEECRRVLWEFVCEELKLDEKGLLASLED